MPVAVFETSAGHKAHIAHSGPNATAFCFIAESQLFFEGRVGTALPRNWAEWNRLLTWTLIAEGERAVARWEAFAP